MRLLNRFLIFSLITLGLINFSQAQSKGGNNSTLPGSSDNSTPLIPDLGKKTPGSGTHEEEMLHRAEIRRAEEAHKEMLARAKESIALSSEIESDFAKNKSLHTVGLKKLERMEKLVRKIRSGAGGSDDEEPLLNPPQTLDDSIKMLAELSEDLQKKVEKTSRLVTSAAVINQSNQILQLIQHVKSFGRR